MAGIHRIAEALPGLVIFQRPLPSQHLTAGKWNQSWTHLFAKTFCLYSHLDTGGLIIKRLKDHHEPELYIFE